MESSQVKIRVSPRFKEALDVAVEAEGTTANEFVESAIHDKVHDTMMRLTADAEEANDVAEQMEKALEDGSWSRATLRAPSKDVPNYMTAVWEGEPTEEVYRAALEWVRAEAALASARADKIGVLLSDIWDRE